MTILIYTLLHFHTHMADITLVSLLTGKQFPFSIVVLDKNPNWSEILSIVFLLVY